MPMVADGSALSRCVFMVVSMVAKIRPLVIPPRSLTALEKLPSQWERACLPTIIFLLNLGGVSTGNMFEMLRLVFYPNSLHVFFLHPMW